jgi:hypothetical protein
VLIVEGGADVNTKDERGRSIIDLSQHYNRALKTDVLMAFVHERDHPVAERLDLDSLTPEQMNALQEVIKLFNQKPRKVPSPHDFLKLIYLLVGKDVLVFFSN